MPDFLYQIGLQDLALDDFAALGSQPGNKGSIILTAGQSVGEGLTEEVAKELGLITGTPGGSAVIDACLNFGIYLRNAHINVIFVSEGWIGTVAARYKKNAISDTLSPTPPFLESRQRLVAVTGTSTCHVIQVTVFSSSGSSV